MCSKALERARALLWELVGVDPVKGDRWLKVVVAVEQRRVGQGQMGGEIRK